MKSKKHLLFILVSIGVVLAILLFMKPFGGEENQSDKSEQKIAYWVAPMDPNYRQDRPGKSPMGMDLIPVYEEEFSNQTSVPDKSDTTYMCPMHPQVTSEQEGN